MTKNDLHDALKHYFGFEAFKGHQEEIITSVINKENTFVIMPTGGGKSLCYQLPALVLEGTAIVISPLIALMKNQVDAMRGISSTDSIAHVLNSSLTKNEIREVMEDISNGKTKLLYVAPESLIKEEYANFLKTVPISFVAVDENGRPVKIPELVPETALEKERYKEALQRRQLSLVLAGKLSPHDATELKALFTELENGK